MTQIETKEVWCPRENTHLFYYDGCPYQHPLIFSVVLNLLGKEGWWYGGRMPLSPGETAERHFFQREVK